MHGGNATVEIWSPATETHIMGITRSDLESFHQFAIVQVDSGETDLTFAERYELLRIRNPGLEERAEHVATVKAASHAL